MSGNRHILYVSHCSTLSFLMGLLDLKQNFTFENKCLNKNAGGAAGASLHWEMDWENSFYEFLTQEMNKRMGHLQADEWVTFRMMGHLQRVYLEDGKLIICRMLEKFRGDVRKQTWSQPKMNQRLSTKDSSQNSEGCLYASSQVNIQMENVMKRNTCGFHCVLPLQKWWNTISTHNGQQHLMIN